LTQIKDKKKAESDMGVGGRRMSFSRFFRIVLGGPALCLLLAGALAGADAQDRKGWQLEAGVRHPSYAFTTPSTTDIDIDTLVLTCNEVGNSMILQLEIYPVAGLPLIPRGAAASDLRETPHLQLSVDGRVFPVSMLFADDHLLVADAAIGRIPVISRPLVDAMAGGHVLKLRFQLLATHAASVASYDAEATVDLQAGKGGGALGIVRDCLPANGERVSMASR
jgi:hypothetical protein